MSSEQEDKGAQPGLAARDRRALLCIRDRRALGVRVAVGRDRPLTR